MDEVDARRFLSFDDDGPGEDSLDIEGPGEYDRTDRLSAVPRLDFPGLGDTDLDMGRLRPVKSDLLRLRPPTAC